MISQNDARNNEIWNRFTSWLTTLLRRARIDYVRHKATELKTVSLEEVDEAKLAVADTHSALESEFQFEEERLAKAFFSLPLHRQQILTMLFAQEKSPDEIAQELQCSKNYIAMQRHRAIKALRKMLQEEAREDDRNEQ